MRVHCHSGFNSRMREIDYDNRPAIQPTSYMYTGSWSFNFSISPPPPPPPVPCGTSREVLAVWDDPFQGGPVLWSPWLRKDSSGQGYSQRMPSKLHFHQGTVFENGLCPTSEHRHGHKDYDTVIMVYYVPQNVSMTLTRFPCVGGFSLGLPLDPVSCYHLIVLVHYALWTMSPPGDLYHTPF